jgi:hypothetical protein
MVDAPQLIAAIAVLWAATTGLAGVLYRDMKAQIVAERTGCDVERAKDAARIERLEAENKELEAQTRAMAAAALEAMKAVATRDTLPR